MTFETGMDTLIRRPGTANHGREDGFFSLASIFSHEQAAGWVHCLCQMKFLLSKGPDHGTNLDTIAKDSCLSCGETFRTDPENVFFTTYIPVVTFCLTDPFMPFIAQSITAFVMKR